jgi:hypothetical protein
MYFVEYSFVLFVVVVEVVLVELVVFVVAAAGLYSVSTVVVIKLYLIVFLY